MGTIAFLIFAGLFIYSGCASFFISLETMGNLESEIHGMRVAGGYRIHCIWHSNLPDKMKYSEVQKVKEITWDLVDEIRRKDKIRPGIFTMGW